MIFYDGTYRLGGYGKANKKVIRQWTSCSWRVRIIDLSLSQPEVMHLRPFVVVASQTGDGIFKANCAESLGKRICRDFNLNVTETLWIEHFPDDPGHVHVAVFEPKSHFGTETFYSITWRPIRPNELELLRPFIPEIRNV